MITLASFNKARSFAWTAALAQVALSALPARAASFSFEEVRDAVYAHPLTQLPANPGLTSPNFLTVKGFVARVSSTLDPNRPEDLLESPAPKFLHPNGVCAEATWEIFEQSPATGLLGANTKVRAMVRMSTGDAQTTFASGKNRVFGIAVKLFPNASGVATANLFTLDQFGVTGEVRPGFFGPTAQGAPVVFRNEGQPLPSDHRLAIVLINKFFDSKDHPATYRPLYPLTELSVDGAPIPTASAKTPKYIDLEPNFALANTPAIDFRTEVLNYGAGKIKFDIVLPANSLNGNARTVLGKLVLGAPVVSDACDQSLHFNHHPNER